MLYYVYGEFCMRNTIILPVEDHMVTTQILCISHPCASGLGYIIKLLRLCLVLCGLHRYIIHGVRTYIHMGNSVQEMVV